MVDENLPPDPRPLRILFLDLNAYFASCEQQEDPSLRGKPIAVVPLIADTTFVIAASYEAKRFGIKTGTRVDEAKRLCPDLTIVPGRPPLYVHFHRLILEAADTVLPVDKVCSIDEMRFRLIGEEREPEKALVLARRMKDALKEGVGEQMTCSVGLAPNSFLGKLATDLQKPDGLVMIQAHELPDRLRGLKLTEFAGINKRMEVRLQAAGMFSSDDMIDASPDELARAFGSVIGERWWYLLRGYDIALPENERKSLGHSHVLPPDRRNEQGVRDVLMRLATKATARLRANNLWASAMSVHVSGFKKSWGVRTKIPPTQDTITVTQKLIELLQHQDYVGPRAVGITFTELSEIDQVTPSLFDQTFDRSLLNKAVDRVNQKFGKNKVYLAGTEKSKNSADEKIAFNKTWLFIEGKGDNEWPDTFRGPGDLEIEDE